MESIVYNDAHFPYHDEKVLADILNIIEERQPDNIILNGDMLDCYSISTFDKNPFRMFTVGQHGNLMSALQTEINMLKDHFKDLRKIAPNARIVYNSGNHEHRLARYVFRSAPELSGLILSDSKHEVLSLPFLLELDAYNVEYKTSATGEGYVKVGDMLVGHFNKVNKHSAYTARNLLEDKGISIVQAHTHRGGSTYKTTMLGELQAHENFCTCDTNVEYTSTANWQQGFGIIRTNDGGKSFYHPVLRRDSEFDIL